MEFDDGGESRWIFERAQSVGRFGLPSFAHDRQQKLERVV
jgi:hypothetical protein